MPSPNLTPQPSTRGGTRPGAGPKPKFAQPMRVHSIRMTDDQAQYLADQGDGNKSHGLHQLIAQHQRAKPQA